MDERTNCTAILRTVHFREERGPVRSPTHRTELFLRVCATGARLINRKRPDRDGSVGIQRQLTLRQRPP